MKRLFLLAGFCLCTLITFAQQTKWTLNQINDCVELNQITIQSKGEIYIRSDMDFIIFIELCDSVDSTDKIEVKYNDNNVDFRRESANKLSIQNDILIYRLRVEGGKLEIFINKKKYFEITIM